MTSPTGRTRRPLTRVGDTVWADGLLASIVRFTAEGAECCFPDGTSRVLGPGQLRPAVPDAPLSDTDMQRLRSEAWSQVPRDEQDKAHSRLAWVIAAIHAHGGDLPFGPLAAPRAAEGLLDTCDALLARVKTGQEANPGPAVPPPRRTTLRAWIQDFCLHGEEALIDSRKIGKHERPGSRSTTDRHLEVLVELLDEQDGSQSVLKRNGIYTLLLVAWQKEGLALPSQPVALRMIDEQIDLRGRTPKRLAAHKQRTRARSHQSATTTRPGQIVAIDSTPSDVMVTDPWSGKPKRPHITVGIDHCTHAFLGCKVSDSVNGGVIGGLIFDMFHTRVVAAKRGGISRPIFLGRPETLDLSDYPWRLGEADLVPSTFADIVYQLIPGLQISNIRADNFSAFGSARTMGVLCKNYIGLGTGRPYRHADNGNVERWFHTLDSFLQTVPGYLGQNASQRGRHADEMATLTADGLETAVNAWGFVKYNNTPHRSLTVDNDPRVHLTPNQALGIRLEQMGACDIPSDPYWAFDFLESKTVTVNHQGLTLNGLQYNSPMLTQVLRDISQPGSTQIPHVGRQITVLYDSTHLDQVWVRPLGGQPVPVPLSTGPVSDLPFNEELVKAVRERFELEKISIKVAQDRVQRRIVADIGLMYEGVVDKGEKASDELAAAIRDLQVSQRFREHAGLNTPPTVAVQDGDENAGLAPVPDLPAVLSAGNFEWQDLEWTSQPGTTT